MKVVMDEVFGESNFVNEVIWKRTGARSGSKSFNHIHDSIFVYTKARPFRFNVQHTPYSDEYLDQFFTGTDPDGTRFRQTILTATGKRSGSSGKPWRGYDPTKAKRHWAVPGFIRAQLNLPEGADTLDALEALDEMGRVLFPKKKGGAPSLKQYEGDLAGVELQSIWSDIRPISAKAKEQQDYPTQKPEALLARLITAFSDEGDLILDCFAGSGTAPAVAEKLGRNWISIDTGKLATYTTQRRLLSLRREVGNSGSSFKPRPFVLQSAGLYDFSSLKDLPASDWRFFALKLFECRDKPHDIGRLRVDGEKGGAPVLVFDWQSDPNTRITEETIDDLHAAVGRFIGPRFYIIAPMLTFDFQQDYIDRGDTRFYALRIPYSVIHELHSHEFTASIQPRGAGQLNELSEAYGFAFSVPPEVEWSASRSADGEHLEIETTSFVSRARIRGSEMHGGLETLAMVLVDRDYDGNTFTLDDAFFGADIESENWVASVPANGIGEQVMTIWIDHHGNEAAVVIPSNDLGSE